MMRLKMRRGGFTLIELLVVIAILGILATFIISAIGGAKNKARAAIASSQIKSLTTALEAYNTDVGFYPRDRNNLAAADIPHLLFAALNNKPTTALGGGPNSPYFDVDRNQIGLLQGLDYRQTLDATGTPSGTAVLPTEPGPGGETLVQAAINTIALPDNANPATASFQALYSYGAAQTSVAINLAAVNNYPVFVDPWINSYHYREWASKAEAVKEALANTAAPDQIPHNFNKFDIWSPGPDGINNYGHSDSDDLSNWGK